MLSISYVYSKCHLQCVHLDDWRFTVFRHILCFWRLSLFYCLSLHAYFSLYPFSWKRKIFLNKMKLSFNLLTNCTCFVCVPKCTWNNKKSYVCVGILPIGRLKNWIEKRNKNEHEIFSKINDLVIYDENERFDWESVHHTPSFQ